MPIYLPSKYKNPVRLLIQLSREKERNIIERGERRAIKLFHGMAKRVPAYKDFLKKNRVNAGKVKTMLDFRSLPTIDKESYLRKYPLEKLCWDGKFRERRWVISTTSGSTGEPFYFPREDSQMSQYAAIAELYLRTNFSIQTRSTLYIDAFPMGAWIGGLFTYEAIRLVANRGKYRLSIITPGIDKKEIINSVKKFGHLFDQIIIGCYGPFLKDAIDEGIEQGLDWRKYNIKFIFSAEGFAETFREYVIEKAGLKNPYKDTLNHYGTVDQGTLSYETPLSILIRRLVVGNDNLYQKIFPIRHKLPTLTQYDPELFFFEDINGELLCSSYSGLPLVRYDLKDHGGVIGFADMKKRFEKSNVDFAKEIKNAKIEDTVWQLPFVYVYERKDFSVSLYAFQIYPETVRKAIHNKKFRDIVTGKFSMMVNYDRNQNQYLEIHVELKRGQNSGDSLQRELEQAIQKQLLLENSEYRKTYSEIPDRIWPHVALRPYEDPEYFKPGVKQRWVIKKNERKTNWQN